MGVKIKWKRNLILLFTTLILLLSLFNPALMAFADLSEANQEFDKKSTEYLEGAEEAKDIIKILDEDSEANPNPDRNTINYVMKRLFYSGVYVNDVRDGVLANDLGKSKSDILYDGKYACNPNAPNNLINHNCNIPNFTTSLVQNVVDPFSQPFSNAEKTSSYSVFGLGVPNNIPGGIVPLKPENRVNTYTALELFGYNLKLTSYNGEWDNVVVSNSARMLSNFGVIDRITLVGTSLWNSAREGVAEFIDNFSFNPVRWYGSIAKSFEAGASAGINTIADTSDLNVVATNAWKRPRLDSSLYNVYVMTDAEVLQETARNYFNTFSDVLNNKASDDEKLNEVISMNPESALNGAPGFTYKPKWETEKSVTKRKNAEKKRAQEVAHNQAEKLKAKYSEDEPPYEAKLISPLTEIPKPVYYTEKEQLQFWEKDPKVASVLNKAKSNNLISGNPSGYGTYDKMMEAWQTSYPAYFERNFDALGETVSEILDKVDTDVFVKYPHLDPKQSISRYACANPDGTIKRGKTGAVEYLYLKNNSGSKEYLNQNCLKARPPIGGGYLGSGWIGNSITDTRHISNVSEDGLGQMLSNMATSTIMSINSFTAKVTNVIIDLSFSATLERLGIVTIVEKVISGFRDTIFFPLASLAGAIGALLLFFEVVKSGSAWRLLSSLAVTLMVFVAGLTFLIHPGATVKVIDEIPAKIDQIVANAILVDDDGSSYCSTGAAKDGIRSAQCNVWGAMVFEPWVHLQFGTGYENLYAKGFAPSEGKEFKNTNGDLVGNAEVNMGGGVKVNNWALYQLSKTKAGTINAKAPKDSLSTIDKDLYRLVDLQAGPNNAAGSDTRYFKSWTGEDRGGFLVILTLIQSILMLIAIGGLGFLKIEVSFMFAITLILLPFMLIFALFPKGRNKLNGYVANLLSMLLKKIFITAMLAILLKIITLGYSKADSIQTGAMLAIFVSLGFMLYRKELLDLMTVNQSGQGIFGSDTSQLRQSAINLIPTGVKQQYSLLKSKVKGNTGGAIGGTVGAIEGKAKIRFRRRSIRKELDNIDKLVAEGQFNEEHSNRRSELLEQQEAIEFAIQNQKRMTEEEYNKLKKESNELYLKTLENEKRIAELLQSMKEEDKEEIAMLSKENEEIEERREEIATEAAGGVRDSKGVVAQTLRGAVHSRGLIGRKAERRLRSKGYAPLTAYRDVKDAVFNEGANNISNMKEGLEYDVYKEVLSKSKANISKGSVDSVYDKDIGQLDDPKVQKYIRKLADERRKIIKKDDEQTAITPDEDNIKKVAEIIDKRRTLEKHKLAISQPIAAYNAHQEDLAMRNRDSKEATSEKIIREIEEHIENNGAIPVDENGNAIIKERELEKLSNIQENLNEEYEQERDALLSEIEKINEANRQKILMKREELDKLRGDE